MTFLVGLIGLPHIKFFNGYADVFNDSATNKKYLQQLLAFEIFSGILDRVNKGLVISFVGKFYFTAF